MKKTIFLAMSSLFLGFAACAETPSSVVNLSEKMTEAEAGASSVDVKNALVFNARCGEGPIKKDSEVYLAAEENEDHLFIGFSYSSGDGAGIGDGLMELYFENANGVYSSQQSAEFDKPVWIYLVLTDELVDVDVNDLEFYFDEYLVQSYVKLESRIDSIELFFTQVLEASMGESNASGQDQLSLIDSIETSVLHGDHPHFPSCGNITWSNEVIENYTFNLQGGHDGHDHEDDHDDHGHDDDHDDHPGHDHD